MAISNLIKTPPRAFSDKFDYKYTPKDVAEIFVNNLGVSQKNRIKKMMEHDISLGKGISDLYGVSHETFITELKAILNGR